MDTILRAWTKCQAKRKLGHSRTSTSSRKDATDHKGGKIEFKYSKKASIGKMHLGLYKDLVLIVGKVREIKEFLCNCNCKVLYWKCCKHFEQFVICCVVI